MLAIFFTLSRSREPIVPSLDSAYTKDVRRLNAWPQSHIITLAPCVPGIAVQQVVDEEAFICGTADLVEIEIGPAALFVE